MDAFCLNQGSWLGPKNLIHLQSRHPSVPGREEFQPRSCPWAVQESCRLGNDGGNSSGCTGMFGAGKLGLEGISAPPCGRISCLSAPGRSTTLLQPVQIFLVLGRRGWKPGMVFGKWRSYLETLGRRGDAKALLLEVWQMGEEMELLRSSMGHGRRAFPWFLVS